MDIKKQNPAALAGATRVGNIIIRDAQNLIEVPSEVQATRALMRRFPITFWHAKTICELYGLGGAA